LDVLWAVVDALPAASDARTAAAAAANAAERTVSETRNLVSARGRAAWVGQRSAGELDPGSVAVLRFLEDLRDRIN
ncbi:MAG UNVERIFIED_CONTAM: DAK2 domain-containing protein, partial [Thermobifida fusca]